MDSSCRRWRTAICRASCCAAPAGVTTTCSAVASQAVAHEIDVGMVGVCGPVALEVLQERGPVRLQLVHFEIAQRKRKPVVDADDRWAIFGQAVSQPLGDAPARPVLARARWREHFLCCGSAVGAVDAQPLQAGLRCLGTGIVDADVPGKGRNLRHAGLLFRPAP